MTLRRIARKAIFSSAGIALALLLPGCPMILGLDKDYTDIGQADSGADANTPDTPADTPPENACGNGRLVCSGNCIDVTSDPNNCGVCDKKCAMGFTCAMSACGNDVVQLAAGGVLGCLAGVGAPTGQGPLAAVPVQLRRAPTQQECRATGHTRHGTVEPGEVAGHHGHVVGGDVHRIVQVAAGLAVDDHDRHGGVLVLADRGLVALVRGQVGAQPLAQVGVVGDHGCSR